MTITTIPTSQSPDAKPVVRTIRLNPIEYVPLIVVPNFQIPELVFGGSTVDAPGVAEVISPLILTNKSSNTVYVDIQVYRFYDYSGKDPAAINDTFFIATQIPVGGYDVLPFPMNGQFFYNGDVLQLKASEYDAIDATLSFTIGQAEEFFLEE